MLPTESLLARIIQRPVPLGLTLLTLGLSACNSGTTPTAPAQTPAAARTFVYDGQDHSWQGNGCWRRPTTLSLIRATTP